MAFEIIWTKRAVAGYENIIAYLEENFTEKEIIYLFHLQIDFSKI